MSPDLIEQLSSGKPLLENIFRYGSDRWGQLIREAREEYESGNLTEVNEYDFEVLESQTAELGEYNGVQVLLEAPLPIHDRRGWFEVFVQRAGFVERVEFEDVTTWDFVTK